jgi:aldehyde dehydrogenase family protein/regulatory Fis family protein
MQARPKEKPRQHGRSTPRCRVSAHLTHVGADDEAHAERRLQRKTRAAPGHDVERQPGVLPELPLITADVIFAAFYRPEQPSNWVTATTGPKISSEQAVARTRRIEPGDPLDTGTRIGAQASNDQLEKILSYIDIGKKEGAKVLTGGKRAQIPGDLAGGYYVEPTVFEGNNRMRILQTLERVLAEVGGNVSLAARRLGVARSTVYRMMRRHEL